MESNARLTTPGVPLHGGVLGKGRRTGTRILLGLALILVGWESWLLVSRARTGRSDIGVFLRSAGILNEGAGPEFYQVRDSSGWYHAVPPAALAPFQPLALLGSTGAGIVWALANLLFLFVALRSLRSLVGMLGREGELDRDLYPWLAALLMVMAAGSIQVGQFSLLFLTCWMLALEGMARGRFARAGFALALPVAIKVYPVLLLAVPAVLEWKAMRKVFAPFLAGIGAFTLVLPWMTVGWKAGPMVLSWVRYGLLGADGRVEGYLAGPGPATTQSLGSLLSRYLAGGSSFHARYTWLPHLQLAPALVLGMTGAACLAMVFLSAWATLRLRRSRVPEASRLFLSLALWSATLYAVLPETKARYAVYTFLAFIPMVDWTFRAVSPGAPGDWIRRGLLTGGCLAAVLQALPQAIIVLGLGYLGSLALWAWNLKWAFVRSSSEALQAGREEAPGRPPGLPLSWKSPTTSPPRRGPGADCPESS